MSVFTRNGLICRRGGNLYICAEDYVAGIFGEKVESGVKKVAEYLKSNEIKLKEVTVGAITCAELDTQEVIETALAVGSEWPAMYKYAEELMKKVVACHENAALIADLPMSAIRFLGFGTQEINALYRGGIKMIGDLYCPEDEDINSRVVYVRGISDKKLIGIFNSISGGLSIENKECFLRSICRRMEVSVELGKVFKSTGLIRRMYNGVGIDLASEVEGQFSPEVTSGIHKIADAARQNYFPIAGLPMSVIDRAGLDIFEVTALGILFRRTWLTMYGYANIIVHKYFDEPVNHINAIALPIEVLYMFGLNDTDIIDLHHVGIFRISNLFAFDPNGYNDKLVRSSKITVSLLMRIYGMLSRIMTSYEKNGFLNTIAKKRETTCK